MKYVTLALAASALALAIPAVPAGAAIETLEARQGAVVAALDARKDMRRAFGKDTLKNGQFVWKEKDTGAVTRLVISLPDQLAYAYRGRELVAVSTISSGTARNPTPTGVFSILEKKRRHRGLTGEACACVLPRTRAPVRRRRAARFR